jgi:hypothetical protein
VRPKAAARREAPPHTHCCQTHLCGRCATAGGRRLRHCGGAAHEPPALLLDLERPRASTGMLHRTKEPSVPGSKLLMAAEAGLGSRQPRLCDRGKPCAGLGPVEYAPSASHAPMRYLADPAERQIGGRQVLPESFVGAFGCLLATTRGRERSEMACDRWQLLCSCRQATRLARCRTAAAAALVRVSTSNPPSCSVRTAVTHAACHRFHFRYAVPTGTTKTSQSHRASTTAPGPGAVHAPRLPSYVTPAGSWLDGGRRRGAAAKPAGAFVR